MKKRVISIVLAVMLLSTLFPQFSLPVMAADSSGTWSGLNWSFDESTGILEISGSGMATSSAPVGYPWNAFRSRIKFISLSEGLTSIGAYAFYGCKITSLTIPNSVKHIREYAFRECSNLTNLTISDGVMYIDEGAFWGCSSLSTVYIPSSTTNINRGAFAECGSLTAISVAPDNDSYYSDDGVLFQKKPKALIQYPAGKTGSYQIPDGITSIWWSAFYGCANLTSVTIPNGVNAIPDNSFRDCSNMTSVTIPSGVTSIGSYAFSGCNSLTSVLIPSSVTDIYDYAFENVSPPKFVILNKECNINSTLGSPTRTILYGFKDSTAESYAEKNGFSFVDIEASLATYTVYYNGVGGSNVPSTQMKTQGTTLTLSDAKPIRSYVIFFEANGGNVTPSSQYVGCTFLNWNTAKNGSGLSYAPGTIYSTDADVILYAQWTNPTAGTLPMPTRPGYSFDGWYSEKIGGTLVTSSTTVSENMKLYAHWIEIIPDATGQCGENLFWKYNKNTGKLSITGGGAMYDWDAEDDIPWHSYIDTIKIVSLSEGLTNIGQNAFSGCSDLKTIMIPANVTSIGEAAFSRCSSLKMITIPDGVTSIGKSAFQGCSNLEEVAIPYSVTNINASTFSSCNSLINVRIPSSVTSIGSNAFSDCSSLTSITIPKSVTIIEENTFDQCSHLTEVKIKNADCAIFDNSITLGNYKRTRVYGFKGSTAQAYAEKNGYSFFEEKVPDFSGTCGDNLNWEFDESTGTLTITGSGDMKSWNTDDNPAPWNSFREQIKSVSLPSTLTKIGYYAFWDCNNLISVTIPSKVWEIGNGAFQHCICLTNVAILEGVYRIDDEAFNKCYYLTSISIPSSVGIIGTNAFHRCDSLAAFDVNEENRYFSSEDGVLYNKEKTRLLKYPGGRIGDYQIPEGVQSIYSYSFAGCRGLSSISIPESVTSITNHAFTDCGSLSIITLPGSLTIMGEYLFQGCSNLSNVILSEGITSIGFNAFNRCDGLKNISIPNSVTSIDWYAFQYCTSLTSVTIPNSVASIGPLAFAGCSSLRNVTILNKECSINDYSTTLGDPQITIIHGYNNSTAQSYAAMYGYSFVELVVQELYYVSYDANGGTGAPSEQTKTQGESITLSSQEPTKSYTVTLKANGGSITEPAKIIDCIFKDWNTGENGDGTTYISGDSYADDSNVILYAQWVNPNLGTLPTPTRSGFNFEGWFTAENGGSEVTSATTVTRDMEIYAHWTPIPSGTYGISYNANGGIGAPQPQTKIEGIALTLSSEQPTKVYTIEYNANGGSTSEPFKVVNCIFQSWNTEVNGEETSYDPGDPYTDDEDVTLYAQWKNPVLGTLPVPTRSGFSFDGWFTTINDGYEVANEMTVSGNMTIYAHWTPIFPGTYEICYNANGGLEAPTTQMKEEGVSLTLSTQVPTKTYIISYNANGGNISESSLNVECTFQAWNTEADGSGMAYAPGDPYTNDKDTTLYAQWKNPTVGSLPTPIRDNYIFDGWYTQISEGDLVTNAIIITENITFYAHWKEISSDEQKIYGTNLNWRYDEKTETLIITGSGAIPNWSSYTDTPWYNNVENIKNISLPAQLTSIGAFAFSHCSNLTSVMIPSGVTNIGKNAFEFCGKLTSVLIPNSVVSIGRTAFEYCSNLVDATIGVGVLQIEEGIFRHCESIKSVKILNPNCNIHFSSSSTLGNPRQTLIIGEKGSTAEGYAKKFDYKFVGLNKGAIFNDVSINAFYSEPVAWAVDRGITTGTSAITFSPESTCTRAQVVTFLWRAAGKPEPKGTDNPFNDIGTNTYYYKAVLWAVENGITTGTSATTFSPNSNCQRAQVVTFLHRASNSPESASSSNPFDDVAQGAYYYDAVLWAVNHSPQITNGISATTFSPNATCTRGQIVTFLYRSMK